MDGNIGNEPDAAPDVVVAARQIDEEPQHFLCAMPGIADFVVCAEINDEASITA